jgi:hypothetical protein
MWRIQQVISIVNYGIDYTTLKIYRYLVLPLPQNRNDGFKCLSQHSLPEVSLPESGVARLRGVAPNLAVFGKAGAVQ